MTNEIEMLRRFGRQAAAAAGQLRIDVAPRVLCTLNAQPAEAPGLSLRPLVAVAAASWLAVFATGALVYESLSSLYDPVASLISPFVVAMQ